MVCLRPRAFFSSTPTLVAFLLCLATACLPVAVAETRVYGPNGVLSTDCTVTVADTKGKSANFALKGKVGNYKKGAMSSAGFYQVVQSKQGRSSQNSTFWFQICEDMEFHSHTDAPDCGSKYSTDGCPDGCVKDNTCGVGCAAMMSVGNQYFTTCFDIGEWMTKGSIVANVSAFDPTDITKGVQYTMTGGDKDYYCPNGRSLAVDILCPDKGRKGSMVPPTSPKSQDSCNYRTTLVHPAGCPAGKSKGGGSGGGSSGGGLTWGGTFLIIFFVGGFVYLAGGAFYNHKYAEKTGVDLIPNIEFWRELPGYEYDGVVYFWEKCCEFAGWVKSKISGDSSSGFSSV